MSKIYLIADSLSGIDDPLGGRFTSLSNVIGAALTMLVGFGWFLAFYNIALGFNSIVTAGSSPDNAKKGQQRVMYGIIGGMMLFFVSIFRKQILVLLGADGFSVGTVTNF